MPQASSNRMIPPGMQATIRGVRIPWRRGVKRAENPAARWALWATICSANWVPHMATAAGNGVLGSGRDATGATR